MAPQLSDVRDHESRCNLVNFKDIKLQFEVAVTESNPQLIFNA